MDIKTGSLFDSKCEWIVNPVNSVGVMGAGLAKQFHIKYPTICDHYNSYSQSYQQNFKSNKLMEILLYSKNNFEFLNHNIIMFPTKIHWKNPSKLKYIEEGLLFLKDHILVQNKPSIAFPALGCGLGGLAFDNVLKLFEKTGWNEYPNVVEVYSP